MSSILKGQKARDQGGNNYGFVPDEQETVQEKPTKAKAVKADAYGFVPDEPETEQDPLKKKDSSTEQPTQSTESGTGSPTSFQARNYTESLRAFNKGYGELEKTRRDATFLKQIIDEGKNAEGHPLSPEDITYMRGEYNKMAAGEGEKIKTLKNLQSFVNAHKEEYKQVNTAAQEKLFDYMNLSKEDRWKLAADITKKQRPDLAAEIDAGRVHPDINMDADELAQALTGKSLAQIEQHQKMRDERGANERFFGSFGNAVMKTIGFELPAATSASLSNVLSKLKIKDEDTAGNMVTANPVNMVKEAINMIPGAKDAVNKQVDDARVELFDVAKGIMDADILMVPINGTMVPLHNDKELIQGLSQVKQPADILDFLGASIGQGAAQILPSIATRGGTSFVQELGHTYLEGVIAKAKATGKTPEEIIRSDEDEPEIARMAGLIQGSMESIGAAKVLEKVGMQPIVKDIKSRALGWLKSVGGAVKGAGSAAKTEFLTETGQGLSQQVAVSKMEGLSNIEAVKNINWIQAIDEGIAGAVGGGGIASVGHSIQALTDLRKMKDAPADSPRGRTYNTVLEAVIAKAKEAGDPRSDEEIKKFVEEEFIDKFKAEPQPATQGETETQGPPPPPGMTELGHPENWEDPTILGGATETDNTGQSEESQGTPGEDLPVVPITDTAVPPASGEVVPGTPEPSSTDKTVQLQDEQGSSEVSQPKTLKEFGKEEFIHHISKETGLDSGMIKRSLEHTPDNLDIDELERIMEDNIEKGTKPGEAYAIAKMITESIAEDPEYSDWRRIMDNGGDITDSVKMFEDNGVEVPADLKKYADSYTPPVKAAPEKKAKKPRVKKLPETEKKLPPETKSLTEEEIISKKPEKVAETESLPSGLIDDFVKERTENKTLRDETLIKQLAEKHGVPHEGLMNRVFKAFFEGPLPKKKFLKKNLLDADMYRRNMHSAKGPQAPENFPTGEVNVQTVPQKVKKASPEQNLQDTIASQDELRPAMTGVYHDTKNKVMVATDGHILAMVPDEGAKETHINRNGKVIDERFPDYQGVMPESNPYVQKDVDVQEWLDKSGSVARANEFTNSDASIVMRVGIGDHDFFMNAGYVNKALGVFAANGVKKVEVSFNKPNRAILFKAEGITVLVMPLMGSTETSAYQTLLERPYTKSDKVSNLKSSIAANKEQVDYHSKRQKLKNEKEETDYHTEKIAEAQKGISDAQAELKKLEEKPAKPKKSDQIKDELDVLYDELNKAIGGTMASGINPEAAKIGAKIVGKYIELGLAKFSEIASAVYDAYGERGLRYYFPFIKLAYEEKTGETVEGTADQYLAQLQPTKAPEGSGIKKALVPEERVEQIPIRRRSNQVALDEGKAVVDSGEVDPEALVREVNAGPRALQAQEVAALVYYKTRLDNQVDRINKKLLDKPSRVEEIRLKGELNNVLEKIDAYHEMSVKTAYEQSLAFRLRQMLLDSEYNLQTQVRQYKAVNGGTISPAQEAKFKEMDQRLKEANSKLEEYEKQAKARKENEAFTAIQNENVREDKRKGPSSVPKPRKGKDLMAEGMEDLAAALGVTKLAHGELRPSIVAALTKIGKGMIDEGLATLENVQEKVRDYVKDKFGDKINYDEVKDDVLKEITSKIPRAEMREDRLYIPPRLLKALVRDGASDIEQLTDQVMEIVHMDFPDATRREVRDAITRYGEVAQLSKDEIDVKLREMKRIGKLVSGLEDVQNQMRPLKSGLQRDKMSDEERRLQKELKEAMKDLPIDDVRQADEWKNALEGVKSRLRNQIADLQHQLDTGEKTSKKKGIEYDAEAQALAEHRDALREILEDINGKPGMSEEQRVRNAIASAERSAAEYERRIAAKDFKPLPKAVLPETPELRTARTTRDQLKEQYQELKKKTFPPKSKEQLATEASEKAMEKRIKELEDKIAAGDATRQAKTSQVQQTAQITAAKERLQELNDQMKQLREISGQADKERLDRTKKAIGRSIAEFERRIRDKDFEREKPKPVTPDQDMQDLITERERIKHEFDVEQEKNRMANRSMPEKVQDFAQDLWNLPKSLLSSVDFSAPLRQGAILSAAHPLSGGKAFAEMFKFAASEKRFDDWFHKLKANPIYPLIRDSKLYLAEPSAKLTAREENFMSSLAGRIPALGPLIKGSERAYTGYLNALRLDVFANGAARLRERGITPDKNPEAYKAWAEFINNATGRGNLGKLLERAAPILNGAMFSPRYLASRFNILNPVTYAKMPKSVRQMALRDVVTYVGFGLTVLTLAAAAGADVEDDPRSTDFGKIKIGDTRYDIWAGFQPIVRAITQFISGQKKNSAGEIIQLGGEEFGSDTRWDVIDKFFRTKYSPGLGAIRNLSEGKDVLGRPATPQSELTRNLIPLYLQDMKEIYDKEGGKGLAATAIPAAFGVGVQSYGPPEDDPVYDEEEVTDPEGQ